MKTITDATRLTVLKHLAKGKTPDVVAAATKLDRYQVLDIGSHHGYPHLEKMGKAVELLTAKLDRLQLDTVPPATPVEARPGRPAPPPARRHVRPTAAPTSGAAPEASSEPAIEPAVELAPEQPVEQPVEPGSEQPVEPGSEQPVVLTKPDELRVLINAGKLSTSKRAQKLTSRILNDLDRLQTLLQQEAAKVRAAQEAAQHKAQLQAKRDRLEAELAKVKAELTGRATTPASPGVTAKPAPAGAGSGSEPSAREVRSWASEAGVECPTHGRVPGRVREAYAAAHDPEGVAA